MSHGIPWTPVAIVGLFLLVVAAGILVVGYAAYRARRAREEAELEDRAPGPDPVDELADVNEELADRLEEGRRSLEATREAVRDGVRW